MVTTASRWINHHYAAVLSLGFFSGLPLFLTSSTLQAWFATEGVSIKHIGFLSLLGLPYLFKFCWAPLLDSITPPFLGRRRGWIFITQLGLVITLLFIAGLHPASHILWMGMVAFCIAFLSASQDIAINAYQVELLHPEERGLGAAMGVFGYRMAMLVSGGLALISADHWGWSVTYALMACIMVAGLMVSWRVPNIIEMTPPRTFVSAVIDPLKEFLSRDRAVLMLGAIMLYELGTNFVTVLNSTFFLRELHFSLTIVGTAYKVVGFMATVVGLFTGGYILARIGLYRALITFGIIQALASFLFVILALMGKNYPMMLVAVTGEYLGMGLGTAALFAWLMSLCDHRYTATQFALFSALASICRVFAGPIAGYLVTLLGWPLFYGWGALMSLPGLYLLWLLKDQFKPLSHQI